MNLRRTAAALLLFSALATPHWAMAQDVPPVVGAMLKNWEAQYKIKPTYKAVSGDAANSTVEGIEFSVPAENGSSVKVTLGKLDLKGVSDAGNGLFEIGTADYSDLRMDIGAEGQAIAVTMPTAHAEGVYVKQLGDNPTPADTFRASMNIVKKLSTGPITVNTNGQNFTADGVEATWDGDPATGAGKSSMKVSNIAVPEAALAQIDPTGALKGLGYSSLAFDIEGAGDMTNDGTNFGFDFDTTIAARNMGNFKMGAAAAGIPIAAIHQLQQTEPGKEPDMQALMPQLMNVQVGRVTFRFEDASITKKLLPMLAQMQGMDEATFVANAGAMAQLGLAELKNPEFTAAAVAAINNFLKDPQSITISAQPAAPVTVMQLMQVDPANPGAAIQQFGVSIKAND